MRRNKSGKRTVRAAAYLLAAVLAVSTFAGCGGIESGGEAEGTADSGNEKEAGEQNNAMGRYVEKDVELGGSSLTDWNSRLFRQEDGSFLLADNSGFVLRSTDNGASWVREDMAWLARMKEENKYILTMAIGPDGTAAVVWTEPEEGTEDSGNGVQLKMDMQLTLIKTDGTEIPAEIKLEEGEWWINGVYISNDGRVFATAAGPNLYEVKEDGSSEKYLTIDGYSLDLVQFHGNFMLLDGYNVDVPLIYDMEAREYIEDEVLTEFVRENFAEREGYAGKGHDLFLVSGGDDAIYLAGRQGVYRHVLGGSAMEQVIDGNLNILGNPAYQIMDMLVADSDEFLVVLTGERMARFVYDPNVPSRPEEKLQVWSLEDEPVIRQVVSEYQKENPAVYVEYGIGLTGNSVTREDAIKNLNTRTMAGKGPDVLVLDNMPMESYMEKGILMDMAPLLESMGDEEAVFPNIVEAFKNDGHVYTTPCRIQLPYIFGKDSDTDKMTGLSSIADEMELMRENDPDAYLMGLPSAKGMMRVFSPACVPAWRTRDGALDNEAVSDFLRQTKRMYDAQMEGLPEEAAETWEGDKSYYEKFESPTGEALEDSDQMRTRHEAIHVLGERRQFVAGVIKDTSEYNSQLSIPVMEGFEEYGSVPMEGQSSNVFWARTLLGINASSQNVEQAQDFVKTALGNKVQTEILNGFPVTKKALLDTYEDQWKVYRDNDYVSGQGGTYDLEDDEIILLIRVPDEKAVNELVQWIESLDTVYVEDKTFENVVYEEGQPYLEGSRSLEDAMSSIETRLGIYLTE